jgi:hypothetical protein
MAPGLEDMKDTARPAHERIVKQCLQSHKGHVLATSLRLSGMTSLRLILYKGRHDLRKMFRLTQCKVSYVYL